MTWKPTTYTRHQLEERRLEAARLLKRRRLSKALIAKRLGVSRAAVSQWAKRLRSGGLRRLHSRKSSGRPAQLTAHQKPPLLRLLKRGALAAGDRQQARGDDDPEDERRDAALPHRG